MPRTIRKLSKGIYLDRYGIRAVVDVAAGRDEARYHRDTPLDDVKRWREETIVRLKALARRRPSRAGTLRLDAARYLALPQIKALASWKARRSELDAWVAELRDRPRGSITEADVRAVVAKWLSVDGGRLIGSRGGAPGRRPYSVRTCEHRVATLRHLFHVLDGPDVITPCDGIAFTLPPTRPVLVTPAVIRHVFSQLVPKYPQTAARHAVLSSTGARAAELMRANPLLDVNLRARLWVVRTAKGGEARTLWLNDDAVAAWRYFIKVGAQGHYDTSTHAKRLYKAGWPKFVRPSNTRATFGMEVSRRGADLHDVQQLLGHRDAKTTRAFYVPPIDSRLAAAARSVGRRFRWKNLGVSLGSGGKSSKKR